MIDGLKPYPEFKPSGLPWLARMPSHWRVVRNGSLFAQRNQTGFAHLPILEVSLRTGVRVRDFATSARKQVMSDFAKYKRAAQGDLAYNMMRMWQGAVGVVPVDGLVSPAYVVVRPFADVIAPYYDYLFRTAAYMSEVDAFSRGIVKDRNRLYWDQFKQMPSPCPDPDEQAAIVRFLDHANGRIERAIRAKKKLIALLSEQKQALIHRAVTRGLDPTVPLKPSGIPWLGDIPTHWEILRCGNLFSEVIDTGHPDALLLSIDRFKGVIPQAETGRRTRASTDRNAYKRIRPGQLAYNLMNAFMGALGFSNHDGIVSPAYAVAQPRLKIEPLYFHHLLRTSAYTGEFNRLSYGIMYERNRLYFVRFKLVPALIPPVTEQAEIVSWLVENTATLDTTINRIEREISLLREYRTRLVSDVVTGQLDVREAARHLPAETDEPDDRLDIPDLDPTTSEDDA